MNFSDQKVNLVASPAGPGALGRQGVQSCFDFLRPAPSVASKGRHGAFQGPGPQCARSAIHPHVTALSVSSASASVNEAAAVMPSKSAALEPVRFGVRLEQLVLGLDQNMWTERLAHPLVPNRSSAHREISQTLSGGSSLSAVWPPWPLSIVRWRVELSSTLL